MHWVFSVIVEKPRRREWRLTNPADAHQVFYFYATRTERPGKPARWERQYGRTAAAPDMPISEMETLFKAAWAAHKESS